jgi:hypothetical protein
VEERSKRVLNSNLRHEFKTGVCCCLGAVRATAEALRSSFSAEQLPLEYEAEIRGIESHLGALLKEFNQIADDYNGSIPVDLELADLHYQRGVREWREGLDRLLRTVDHVLAAVPGADNQEVREMLAPLRRLQHQPVNTLKEILEKWGTRRDSHRC